LHRPGTARKWRRPKIARSAIDGDLSPQVIDRFEDVESVDDLTGTEYQMGDSGIESLDFLDIGGYEIGATTVHEPLDQ